MAPALSLITIRSGATVIHVNDPTQATNFMDRLTTKVFPPVAERPARRDVPAELVSFESDLTESINEIMNSSHETASAAINAVKPSLDPRLSNAVRNVFRACGAAVHPVDPRKCQRILDELRSSLRPSPSSASTLPSSARFPPAASSETQTDLNLENTAIIPGSKDCIFQLALAAATDDEEFRLCLSHKMNELDHGTVDSATNIDSCHSLSAHSKASHPSDDQLNMKATSDTNSDISLCLSFSAHSVANLPVDDQQNLNALGPDYMNTQCSSEAANLHNLRQLVARFRSARSGQWRSPARIRHAKAWIIERNCLFSWAMLRLPQYDDFWREVASMK